MLRSKPNKLQGWCGQSSSHFGCRALPPREGIRPSPPENAVVDRPGLRIRRSERGQDGNRWSALANSGGWCDRSAGIIKAGVTLLQSKMLDEIERLIEVFAVHSPETVPLRPCQSLIPTCLRPKAKTTPVAAPTPPEIHASTTVPRITNVITRGLNGGLNHRKVFDTNRLSMVTICSHHSVYR